MVPPPTKDELHTTRPPPNRDPQRHRPQRQGHRLGHGVGVAFGCGRQRRPHELDARPRRPRSIAHKLGDGRRLLRHRPSRGKHNESNNSVSTKSNHTPQSSAPLRNPTRQRSPNLPIRAHPRPSAVHSHPTNHKPPNHKPSPQFNRPAPPPRNATPGLPGFAHQAPFAVLCALHPLGMRCVPC